MQKQQQQQQQKKKKKKKSPSPDLMQIRQLRSGGLELVGLPRQRSLDVSNPPEVLGDLALLPHHGPPVSQPLLLFVPLEPFPPAKETRKRIKPEEPEHEKTESQPPC